MGQFVMHCARTPQMTRRRLMGTALAAGPLALTFRIRNALSQTGGPCSLPALPYAENALVPLISAMSIGVHYGMLHKASVDNPNKAVDGTARKGKSLEEIVEATFGD